MAKEERIINDNNPQNELSLDELDEVSGGRISIAGYTILYAAVKLIKSKGKDKEYAIREITEGWNQDCDFKKFTNGTEDDLKRVVQFINLVW
ncbi:MAG: hypothetical protein IKP31_06405 [Lachnospiraceae bacterium]|nr:hypothetical protein [Lachnospiraceae bacterium]